MGKTRPARGGKGNLSRRKKQVLDRATKGEIQNKEEQTKGIAKQVQKKEPTGYPKTTKKC